MARKLRVEYQGAIYHVTIRGVERRPIFKSDRDRERFVRRMGDAVEEYGVRVYQFCLMRNHVHWLLETPKANLSAFMHKLQTAYTVYFNLRHNRAGHLMQGRYGAVPVEGDDYLLRLSRYIHLNPVFVDDALQEPLEVRMDLLRSYPWSSFRGYTGLGKTFGFVEEGPILALSGGNNEKGRQAYRRYVEGGLVTPDEAFLEEKKAWSWGIGDEEFQDRVRDLHSTLAVKVKRREDVAFRKESGHVDAARVLGVVGDVFGVDAKSLRKRQYGCVARSVAASMLGRYAGMNQRDVGSYLRIGTGVSVCLHLKRLRDWVEEDTSLAKQMEAVRAILDGEERDSGKQLLITKG